MKLRSLKLRPSHAEGWSSRDLHFGDEITQLFGPNGCGKTPLLQSVAFALGYPVIFRDDVTQNVGSVFLEVECHGKVLRIERPISSTFSVVVTDTEGRDQSFFSEADYSRFIFRIWGNEDPDLTSASGKAAKLYVSHLLPIFYLDQDHGYSKQYFAPSQFIKDQYGEVMRVLFGLSPRNPFGRQRLVADLKERVDYVDRKIARSEKLYQGLLEEFAGERRPLEDIDRDLAAAAASLEGLTVGADSQDEAARVYSASLRAIDDRISLSERERIELNGRLEGFVKIADEIEIEANTLSLNEEARRLFASFSQICSNAGCGLFLNSAESYGKSLLYLRDQLKDIGRIKSQLEQRVAAAGVELGALHQKRAELRASQQRLSEQSSVAALVELVANTTERVVALRRERRIVEELEAEERQYVALVGDREAMLDQLGSMNGTAGVADLKALSVRKRLETGIARWLTVLSTPNVSTSVVVDQDFNVTFGEEKIRAFKGSTLIRVVLAIRTAAFEMLCESAEFSPRFLILDTPRQQDITREHHANYIRELKRMAGRLGVQVIFSGSNYHYDKSAGDAEWSPDFPGIEQPMFLGVVA